ncbi:MAG: hypothetical protein WCA20_37095 [Candidatus Sulfotelmatobacter sp.]
MIFCTYAEATQQPLGLPGLSTFIITTTKDESCIYLFVEEIPCSPPTATATYFDPRRVAVSLFDATSGSFYTYDDPFTVFLKTSYINLKVPRSLGGAYVWALKDDDANGTMVKAMAAGLGR